MTMVGIGGRKTREPMVDNTIKVEGEGVVSVKTLTPEHRAGMFGNIVTK